MCPDSLSGRSSVSDRLQVRFGTPKHLQAPPPLVTHTYLFFSTSRGCLQRVCESSLRRCGERTPRRIKIVNGSSDVVQPLCTTLVRIIWGALKTNRGASCQLRYFEMLRGGKPNEPNTRSIILFCRFLVHFSRPPSQTLLCFNRPLSASHALSISFNLIPLSAYTVSNVEIIRSE